MQNIHALDQNDLVERRAHPRLKVNYLTEVYMGSEILFATVVDISEGGIGIILPGQFYIGELLNLRFKCSLLDEGNPDTQEVNICVTAEVIWIKKHDRMYRAGLKIRDIDHADLNKLKENLRILLSKEKE